MCNYCLGLKYYGECRTVVCLDSHNPKQLVPVVSVFYGFFVYVSIDDIILRISNCVLVELL